MSLNPESFTIDQNDNGFHIHGIPYHWKETLIQPLYQTLHSYEDCIKWLDEHYPDNYKVISDLIEV